LLSRILSRKLCGIAIVESLATNMLVKADLYKENTIRYSERYDSGSVITNNHHIFG